MGCRSEPQRDARATWRCCSVSGLASVARLTQLGLCPGHGFPSKSWHPPCEQVNPSSVGFPFSHREAGARTREGMWSRLDLGPRMSNPRPQWGPLLPAVQCWPEPSFSYTEAQWMYPTGTAGTTASSHRTNSSPGLAVHLVWFLP